MLVLLHLDPTERSDSFQPQNPADPGTTPAAPYATKHGKKRQKTGWGGKKTPSYSLDFTFGLAERLHLCLIFRCSPSGRGAATFQRGRRQGRGFGKGGMERRRDQRGNLHSRGFRVLWRCSLSAAWPGLKAPAPEIQGKGSVLLTRGGKRGQG